MGGYEHAPVQKIILQIFPKKKNRKTGNLPKNAAQLNRVVTDMIEEAAEIVSDDKKDQNNDNYDS